MLTFTADRLTQLTTNVFRAAGTPEDIAEVLARALVGANLAGHDSHGVIHIPTYVRQIREGQILPAARPEVVRESPGLIAVDGAWGVGHYVAHEAMRIAADRARERQIALVTVTRCNHIGRLGQWAEEAAAAGVIGMITTSWGGGPFAATPFGGAERVLSTNPIAFGIPLESGVPFILDFATTAVAEGKLRVAHSKGANVPDGWIVDKDGHPTNDPADFYAGGMLLPFGGHKGFALSMVVELLSISLTGADLAPDADGRMNGAVFLAIDPTAARPMAEFHQAATRLNDRVLGVRPAEGSDGVLLPGQPEAHSRELRQREGIPIAESTWEAIQETAREVGATV